MSKILHLRVEDETCDYVMEVARVSGISHAKAGGALLDECRRQGIRWVSVRQVVTVSRDPE